MKREIRMRKRAKSTLLIFLLCVGFLITSPATVQVEGFQLPSLKIGIDKAEEPGDVSLFLQIVLLLTVLTVSPAILILMTSFTRVAVVLSFLRHALGTQQTPSNQVIAGMALFLTFFIMMPVWKDINDQALQPYLQEEISQQAALQKAVKPVHQFMMRQTREKDLALFVGMSNAERPKTPQDVPLPALIPAFVISELKTAFFIGFVLYVPFLIIDMVVASVLLSMGMMMLPPILISLPFKLMLFVLVDGWHLVVGSMVRSFGGG
jgi:flagellar biosynthesis protein FliP